MSSLNSADWELSDGAPMAARAKQDAVPALDARAHAGPSPAITVVVPTYRRPDLLKRCLQCLLDQTLEAARYEIIVCDDGPDEDTRRTVQALAAQQCRTGASIRYIAVTLTQGPAGARNAGWRAARAPLIAFTDDDTEPATQWLSEGLAALGDTVDAVCGRVDVPIPWQPTDYELDASGLANAEFVTANLFVRRLALIQTNGFDERYTAAWREDSDLQFALLSTGAVLSRAELAVVRHPVRPAPWGVSLSQQRKGQFDALLFKKHPELFRKRISAHAPRLYYAILAAAILALGCALAGLLAAAIFASLIWGGLTASFCRRRLAGTARTASHVAEMVWTSICIPFLSIYWRWYGAFKFQVWFP